MPLRRFTAGTPLCSRLKIEFAAGAAAEEEWIVSFALIATWERLEKIVELVFSAAADAIQSNFVSTKTTTATISSSLLLYTNNKWRWLISLLSNSNDNNKRDNKYSSYQEIRMSLSASAAASSFVGNAFAADVFAVCCRSGGGIICFDRRMWLEIVDTSPLRSEIPTAHDFELSLQGKSIALEDLYYTIQTGSVKNVKSKLTIEDDNRTAAVKEETDGCHRDGIRQQHSVSVAYVVNCHPILSVNDDLAITILRTEATMLSLSCLLSSY